MVVAFVEYWITWQSPDALNTAKLVQNAPDREIHVEFIKRSYLRRQSQAVVKDFSRNSRTLYHTKHGEVELLGPIFHVGSAEPLLRFGRRAVHELGLLKDFSEFCHEEGVWGNVDVYGLVEDFSRLGAAFVKSTAGIASGVLVFIGDN